jgi:uncharacterized SAM-binding protein YcdF (DUF218 family)
MLRLTITDHRRLIRWCIGVVLACAVLLIVAWVFREPLFNAVAQAWIVDQPPGKADAIVVPGGGEQYRVARAAEVFHAGVASVILLPMQRIRPTDELDATQPGHDVCLQVLLAKGVPRTAIHFVGAEVRSTREEALAVHQWVKDNHATRIVIPTDIFHTRRAGWIFRRELRGEPTEVGMVAVDPDDYNSKNWWHKEQGLIFFEVEVSKMIYYWFKY